MTLIARLAKFARSPEGRRLSQRAVQAAKDPKTRRQIDDVARRLAARRGGRS
jgi:hypothetical protein